MIKRYRTIIIKLVFGLALLFFITYKIWNEPVLDELNSISLIDNFGIYLLLFILLMFINWSIETLKWKALMKGVRELNFKSALLSVLAGISTGLMTPNRIGNFIGRTLYFEKEIKTKATLLTFMGNMAQFTATIIMGLIGFEIFGRNQLTNYPQIIELIAIFLSLMALYIYFYPKKIKFLKKFMNQTIIDGIDFVQDINNIKKTNILLLSLLRYFVFLTQFYIMLYVFEVDINPIVLLSALSLVFLITTIIPSVLFGKLFVREASAIFVLSQLEIQTPIILLAVFILWLVNLAVPSFIGAYLLIRK